MSKLQTARQFCTAANAALTDAQVARAIGFIAGGVSKHYLLTHIERDMAYPQLNAAHNMVYMRCRSYVLAELLRIDDIITPPAPGKRKPHVTLLTAKLATMQKKSGIEFTVHFHEAFNALVYLEGVVNNQDEEYNKYMEELEKHKNNLLDMEMPWEQQKTKR